MFKGFGFLCEALWIITVYERCYTNNLALTSVMVSCIYFIFNTWHCHLCSYLDQPAQTPLAPVTRIHLSFSHCPKISYRQRKFRVKVMRMSYSIMTPCQNIIKLCKPPRFYRGSIQVFKIYIFFYLTYNLICY